jgi:ArsR family transcriptional regulator
VWYRLADLAVRRLLQDLMALGRKQLAEVEQVVHRYYESPGELEPITPRELRRRLRDGDVLVLDVRPPEEFAAGHIPGAVNIPPDQLRRRLASLPRDRDIVAYCRGPFCLFSVEAATRLRARGFRVRRLAGGLNDWLAGRHSVVTTA